jgi:hypothetical protein
VTRAAALVMFASACASIDEGPRLDAAEPAAAGQGATVMLRGERLCGPKADCASAGGSIQIGLDNPVQANIIDYSDTMAQVRIPQIAPAGRTVIIATVNDEASNALDFEVLAVSP